MKNYAQNELLEVLNGMAKPMLVSSDRKERERGRRVMDVVALVENCDLLEYANIERSSKAPINIGNVVENITLYVKDLVEENEKFEVKSLVNNTPNVLKNENVVYAYFVVCKATTKGVFRVKGSDILNKRMTLENLLACPSLKLNKGLTKKIFG